uniref:Dimer_Tnp_hAT domain-containing protein n=1 Tax=Anopheles funestus TaxID=62324 RepID=A0A182RJX0_ANOFN
IQTKLNNMQLKLILDVATRWNSTYYMLERFYTNKKPMISSLICYNNTSQEVTKLVECLSTGLRQRFHCENTSIVSKATVLDPRFKQKGFSNSNLFKACCDELLVEMGSMNIEDNNYNDEASELAVDEAMRTSESLWEEFDLDQIHPQIVLHSRSSTQIELDNYVAEPNDDPLEWWKLHKMQHPLLYQIMLRVLCIPASSVPCERVFSKAGEIETSKRNR